jgi:hypothetical protein
MGIRYCPYFCEESIWHLCRDEGVVGPGGPVPIGDRRVVFISNTRRRVAMRNQRAGGGRPVEWDCHVVLLAGGRVWDPDTTLGFPVEVDRWVLGSFYPLVPEFSPRFRVIDGPTYVREFASDRSHMLGPDGLPLKPFPTWQRIGVGMTLERFVDMDAASFGAVVDLEEFRRRSRDL